MDEILDEINYDDLINQALRNVVYLALKIVENQGLPSDNYFYISYNTDYPGVRISDNLKVQYPKEMTIILQNHFKNLVVRHNSFSVDLSFGGIEQTITIPFDSITYFADPYAKFGLNFDPEFSNSNYLQSPQKKEDTGENAVVISFDKFKQKK